MPEKDQSEAFISGRGFEYAERVRPGPGEDLERAVWNAVARRVALSKAPVSRVSIDGQEPTMPIPRKAEDFEIHWPTMGKSTK